mmetsp:Transcript_7020/g.19313  ORF Transcript_7020/g.19313 Transcript_7020/m.19313 type:complete len:213 (+) Transcript_7020:687-1325(+)
MITSYDHDPRSTKSPLNKYGLSLEGMPFCSKIRSRSKNCPCVSPHTVICLSSGTTTSTSDGNSRNLSYDSRIICVRNRRCTFRCCLNSSIMSMTNSSVSLYRGPSPSPLPPSRPFDSPTSFASVASVASLTLRAYSSIRGPAYDSSTVISSSTILLRAVVVSSGIASASSKRRIFNRRSLSCRRLRSIGSCGHSLAADRKSLTASEKCEREN